MLCCCVIQVRSVCGCVGLGADHEKASIACMVSKGVRGVARFAPGRADGGAQALGRPRNNSSRAHSTQLGWAAGQQPVCAPRLQRHIQTVARTLLTNHTIEIKNNISSCAHTVWALTLPGRHHSWLRAPCVCVSWCLKRKNVRRRNRNDSTRVCLSAQAKTQLCTYCSSSRGSRFTAPAPRGH